MVIDQNEHCYREKIFPFFKEGAVKGAGDLRRLDLCQRQHSVLGVVQGQVQSLANLDEDPRLFAAHSPEEGDLHAARHSPRPAVANSLPARSALPRPLAPSPPRRRRPEHQAAARPRGPAEGTACASRVLGGQRDPGLRRLPQGAAAEWWGQAQKSPSEKGANLTRAPDRSGPLPQTQAPSQARPGSFSHTD